MIINLSSLRALIYRCDILTVDTLIYLFKYIKKKNYRLIKIKILECAVIFKINNINQ